MYSSGSTAKITMVWSSGCGTCSNGAIGEIGEEEHGPCQDKEQAVDSVNEDHVVMLKGPKWL